MKKLLALLLALAVSFSLAIPAFAANTALDGIEYDGFTVLSNCSDDELLAFLRENDIAIPDGLADSQEHLLELVRYFIAEAAKQAFFQSYKKYTATILFRPVRLLSRYSKMNNVIKR